MKPTKNKIYCPDCLKIKMLFETEKKALNFIKFNKDAIEAETGYSPQRIYFCIFCNGWHTTSNKNFIGISFKEKILHNIMFEKKEQLENLKKIKVEKNKEAKEKIQIEKYKITIDLESQIKDFDLQRKQRFIKETILVTTEEIKKLKPFKDKLIKETIKKKRLFLEVLDDYNNRYKPKKENISKEKQDEWKNWIEKNVNPTK